MTRRLLVVGDNSDDVQPALRLLQRHFQTVATCLDPLRLATEFDRVRPQVLLLAFRQIEAAERASLALYRQSLEIASLAHRSIVLCGKDDVGRAYQLCSERCFDDYVLFWPLAHDAMRLPMSVRLALRALEVHTGARPLPSAAAEAGNRAEEQARPTRGPAPTLPASGPVAEANVLPDPRPQGPPAAPPAVLLVDDDPLLRRLLTHVLAGAGCAVHTAANSAEALERARECHLDLVLMDVGLPDCDGIVTTRRIKALPQCAELPVIMLTGHSQREVIMESRQAGAVDFIVKPIERDTLLAKVARHMQVPVPAR